MQSSRGVLNRIDALDGVRGLSILLTIFFHGVKPLNFGWTAIQLFFVLSGFLITRILYSMKEQNLRQYLVSFYTNRSVRIFPLYFAYLLALALVFVATGEPAAFAKQWGYLVSYTYNFAQVADKRFEFSTFYAHFWSLAVEEQFYLLWPFVVFFLAKRGLRRVCVGLLILAPFCRFVTAHFFTEHGVPASVVGNIVYWQTFNQVDSLAMGALVFLYLEKFSQNIEKIHRMIVVLFVTVGVLNCLYLGAVEGFSKAAFLSGGYLFLNLEAYQHVWGYTLIAFMWGATVLRTICDAECKWWFTQKMQTPWLKAVGKVSYGMYVFHWSLLALVEKLLPWGDGFWVQTLRFALTLGLTYFAASLSFNYFESWFSRFRVSYGVERKS